GPADLPAALLDLRLDALAQRDAGGRQPFAHALELVLADDAQLGAQVLVVARGRLPLDPGVPLRTVAAHALGHLRPSQPAEQLGRRDQLGDLVDVVRRRLAGRARVRAGALRISAIEQDVAELALARERGAVLPR